MSLSDVHSDFNLAGSLPKGSAKRALDAEIANEGAKVIGQGDKIILSNGEQVAWTPPPEKLVIQDLSEVKSLRHYFGQRGYQPYPAWLYHPKLPALLVKDATEAAGRGIVYRKANDDERMRYGIKEVWDWEEGCEWRPRPWHEPKFDPKNPGSGKLVAPSTPDPRIAQNDMVAALIPAVAAAVTQSLSASGTGKPANIDQGQWDQFIAFQAWQKTQEAVSRIADEVPVAEEPAPDLLGNALSPEIDRVLWENEAQRLGIKIDKRWGTERLKEEVQKHEATLRAI